MVLPAIGRGSWRHFPVAEAAENYGACSSTSFFAEHYVVVLMQPGSEFVNVQLMSQPLKDAATGRASQPSSEMGEPIVPLFV